MKLYKYKSLQNFEHFADIILNKRFYAANFYKLNDPMEGLFNFPQGTKNDYLELIKEGKNKLLICSFSKKSDDILLWSHYADGCHGLCIEVEVGNDENHDYSIYKVRYANSVSVFHNGASRLVEFMPELLLSEKNIKWKYEEEVRLLSHQEYVYGPKVTGILLGKRISEIAKQMILKIVPLRIPVYETDIKDNKIKRSKLIDRKRAMYYFHKFQSKS